MQSPFSASYPTHRIADLSRFQAALSAFDQANQQDPNRIDYQGHAYPWQWLHAQALFARTLELNPDPSEPLLLAARCQHLRRWVIPRSSYPEGRKAYLQWRANLKHFHAENASAILAQLGYDEATLAAVRALNMKEDLSENPDAQTIEDALCLVFLQFQFDALIADHPESKIADIVKKTAAKMSPHGLAAIANLPLSDKAKQTLAQALA